MKKYIAYQLKKSLLPFAVMVFAGLILYFVPLTIPVSYRFAYQAENASAYLMIGLIAACILIPVWAFRYKMNKRSTDLYFSLPIKRHHLLLIHYLSGFAAIVAAYTVVFWLGFIVIAVKSSGFALINMLLLYLTNIAAAYVVYSVYSFIYTRANNTIDGLIFMVFATFALMLVTGFLYCTVLSQSVRTSTTYEGDTYRYTVTTHYVEPAWYMPFMPLSVLEQHFIALATSQSSTYFRFADVTSYTFIENVNIIVSMGIYAALSAACTAGLVLTEKKNKAENCEQLSDSPFGYKVMVPLFMFTLCAYVINYSDIFVLLLVIAAGYFVTAIWRRSLKIGWKAFIALAASTICGIIAGVIICILI